MHLPEDTTIIVFRWRTCDDGDQVLFNYCARRLACIIGTIEVHFAESRLIRACVQALPEAPRS
jgi:hypothetical protein